LQWIGRAAKAQKKPIAIILIFSAEEDFSGKYFSSHSFDNAFESINTAYSASNFRGKNYIRLNGYQIFTYTIAKKFSP